MSKKLILFSLSLFFFNNNGESPSESRTEKKDKYEEWCKKLKNLDTEQLRKMSRFLGDVNRGLLAEEKLQGYRESFKGESGYKVGQNADVGNALFTFQTIANDPILLKTLAQVIALTYLDGSYRLSNESIQKLDKEHVLSDSDEKEIFLSIKDSLKKCRLCIKSKLRDKK